MIYEFAFPDVGEGVHEGTVLELKHKPGDAVVSGDILAVVETDKVVAEIPSPRDGVLERYGCDAGDVIEVGQTLAYIRIGSEEEEENAGVVGELETRSDGIMAAGTEAEEGGDSEASADLKKTRPTASPVARRMAADLGVDLNAVRGTGPEGRVMKHDVLEASHSAGTSAVRHRQKSADHGDDHEVIPLDTIRRTIAVNMELSSQIPSALIQDQCLVDELWQMRGQLNRARDRALSFQPFFMKALSLALAEFPRINSHFDRERQQILVFRSINIGIAVDTDRGLMVPVIRDVPSKSIDDLNAEMRSLVEEAVSGRIDLAELRGGTFTITNYGSFGGIYGKPMILPPQTGIMGFGRIHEAPVAENGVLRAGRVLPLSFSFDHRVVDGAYAARFVTRVMHYLSVPGDMWVKL